MKALPLRLFGINAGPAWCSSVERVLLLLLQGLMITVMQSARGVIGALGWMVLGLTGCGGGGTKDLAEAKCEQLESCQSAAFSQLYESVKDCTKAEKEFQEELYKSEKSNDGKKCANARVDLRTCEALTSDCDGDTTACAGEESEVSSLCE